MWLQTASGAAQHGEPPARRSGQWTEPTRKCGVTSGRQPRPTDRCAPTSGAGSNRGWPWLRSGKKIAEKLSSRFESHKNICPLRFHPPPSLFATLCLRQWEAGGLLQEAYQRKRSECRPGVSNWLLHQPLRCSLHPKRRRPDCAVLRWRLQNWLWYTHQW